MISFKKVKNKIKELKWGNYLIELIIVVLGISIAFFLNKKNENLSKNNQIKWIEEKIYNEAYNGLELAKTDSIWIVTTTKEVDSLIQLINSHKKPNNNNKIYDLTSTMSIYIAFSDEFLINHISESNSTANMDIELLELYFSYYSNERLFTLFEDNIEQSYTQTYENILFLFDFNNDTTLVLNNNQKYKHVRELHKLKNKLSGIKSHNRKRIELCNKLIDWLKVNRRGLIRKPEEE